MAIGSIAGSGILFLPSAVYAEAGRESLLVWAVAIGLCLPMLGMFAEMVREHPDGDGIEAFVRAGLGNLLGRCVPLLYLAVVAVGLPAGALVAGRYLAHAAGAGRLVVGLTAAAVLMVALAVTAAGVRASARVQLAGAGALVVMSLVLIVATLPTVGAGTPVLTPNLEHLGAVPGGVVLAFWAFAGFENLTFLAREFRHPERDMLPVSMIALAVYGILTVLLTAAIAIAIPREHVAPVTGLLQLAAQLPNPQVATAVVAVIALGAMLLNAAAWSWGTSRLTTTAARTGVLPRPLADTPGRALLLLAGLFTVVGGILAAFPGLLVQAIAATSSIFIVLYLLTILAYARTRGPSLRTALTLCPLAVFIAALAQSGWQSAYGPAVLAAAIATQLIHRHRTHTVQ